MTVDNFVTYFTELIVVSVSKEAYDVIDVAEVREHMTFLQEMMTFLLEIKHLCVDFKMLGYFLQLFPCYTLVKSKTQCIM